MDHGFWHRRWKKNEIGFHEGSVNTYLREHWPDLALAGSETVFVPLCGKAQDLWWLHERGHTVLGVELSDIACRDFFAEAAVTPRQTAGPTFQIFRHEALQLWCGDFFHLRREDLQGVSLVYDRAALIALPPAMRVDYARHLKTLLPDAVAILLVTLDYPEGEIAGPPFNVSDAEVQALYGDDFDVVRLFHRALPHDDDFARRRGLGKASESVFRITRRP